MQFAKGALMERDLYEAQEIMAEMEMCPKCGHRTETMHYPEGDGCAVQCETWVTECTHCCWSKVE